MKHRIFQLNLNFRYTINEKTHFLFFFGISMSQILQGAYILKLKNVFVVSLKFEFNCCPVFYLLNLATLLSGVMAIGAHLDKVGVGWREVGQAGPQRGWGRAGGLGLNPAWGHREENSNAKFKAFLPGIYIHIMVVK